ncbi:MAG TPA: hotdog fold thioesterase [Burkholderiales bacterium]|nr:hotdog fold thioesterase [Burkholderiales bacterium]
MDRDEQARKRIAHMAAHDPLTRSLGIECIDGGFGRAAVSLKVRRDHLNFNGSCHGGVIFALADTAFGLASNSHGTIAAGIDAHITYQVAVQAGDVLTANAIEITRTRRLGVYRVDVTRADGTPVSSFTGTVYVTSRPHDAKHA